MKNKNQTFESFGLSTREKRLLGFDPTESFDTQKVQSTEDERNKIIDDNPEDLQKQLEQLQKLKREKRESTEGAKDAIKVLEEAIEQKHDFDIPDGQMADMVNQLIEEHDKEVGTAIPINEDYFMLVHASEDAVKLVLADAKIEGDEISADALERIFNKAGFQVQADFYDEESLPTAGKAIPTARPFSQVIEETQWKMKVDVPQKLAAPAVVAAAVETNSSEVEAAVPVSELLESSSKYDKLLDKVFGAEQAAENTVEIKDWRTFLREFKKVGRDISNIQKVERRGKNITEKVKASLAGLEGKADVQVGDKVTFRQASIPHEFFKNPSEANRKKFSSAEFTEKVQNSSLSDSDKTELIEAAIRLDVTVTSRRVKESGLKRGEFLEKQALKPQNGGKKVQELFENQIGTGLEEQDFYKSNPEKSEEKKSQIKNILSGESEVFMLRVDRQETGGDFDSRIESTRGAAWINDLDAPKELRQDKKYEYKYSEISDSAQKTEILKKYLKQDLASVEDLKNYQIAQVEIPNCENPAIVVKKLEKVVPIPVLIPAPEVITKTVALELAAARYFRNTPDGWTRILRIPDWFKSDAQLNHLADPAIVDLQGDTDRKSEYLNARERLEPKPHKFIEESVNDILGWTESLDEYSKEKSEVANPLGKKWSNQDLTTLMAKEYKELFEETGKGETMKSFQKRFKAAEAWKAKWKEVGAEDKDLAFAEVLHDFDCADFDQLSDKMEKEEQGVYLAEFLKDNEEDLEGKTVKQIENTKVIEILISQNVDVSSDQPAKEAIESALYDENKINAARGPLFIGDSVFVPPTIDKNGEPKLSIYQNQTEITSEMIKPHSALSLAMEAASLVGGYLIYIKTGTGLDDAVGNYSEKIDDYLEEADGSQEAKDELKAIFQKQDSFDKFRNFVVKGQVSEKGGNVVSLPINEIQVLIPGWKMIAELCGGSETNVNVKITEPDKPCKTIVKNEFISETEAPLVGDDVIVW